MTPPEPGDPHLYARASGLPCPPGCPVCEARPGTVFRAEPFTDDELRDTRTRPPTTGATLAERRAHRTRGAR